MTLLFNHLTASTTLPPMRKLLVAPSRLQAQMIEKIEREAANQKAGKPARIQVKVNGILEPAVVKAAVPGKSGRRENRNRVPRNLLAATRYS